MVFLKVTVDIPIHPNTTYWSHVPCQLIMTHLFNSKRFHLIPSLEKWCRNRRIKINFNKPLQVTLTLLCKSMTRCHTLSFNNTLSLTDIMPWTPLLSRLLKKNITNSYRYFFVRILSNRRVVVRG